MKGEVGGLHIQYYSICKRKLWLYSRQISFETAHEKVIEGTLLHEGSYKRKKKEIMLGDHAKIDVLDQQFVQETKLSSKMQKADELQLLYYLYLLKQRGIEKRGRIAYTKEKKVVEIELNEENEKKIRKVIAEVFKIIESEQTPKLVKLPYCRNCAYFDFCFALEGGDDDAT
ncbi:CRISPR-associated exonuclease Cas4 [Oikeobacillus pervagus]|uniref:CRISPR-associated exonuclease Cas4 n=1 Tax=Oikeobacillus pervagus TaxID=1325931 RepID=A0AAJ1WKY0_9BACI|nr:CRISPR-associated protein Cas4 [Oikeobacillus pervagus]MDQ0215611.1 CRISPR-associated exonuclease Cas4 [Oikeobacillus pervagus]